MTIYISSRPGNIASLTLPMTAPIGLLKRPGCITRMLFLLALCLRYLTMSRKIGGEQAPKLTRLQ